MPEGFQFDFSAVNDLVVNLSTIPAGIGESITKATAVSANKVKKHWRESLSESAVPAAGSTIQYEVSGGDGGAGAVIQSDRGTARLRGFVHAREYGSPTVAPAADARVALQATTADFVHGLTVAGERAIRRAVRR